MQIIDVRSPQEYDQGHVAEADCFDVERMTQGEMPPVNKDEEVVLYCRTGSRAAIAKELMRSSGYTNVRSAGGLADMSAAGYRVVVS